MVTFELGVLVRICFVVACCGWVEGSQSVMAAPFGAGGGRLSFGTCVPGGMVCLLRLVVNVGRYGGAAVVQDTRCHLSCYLTTATLQTHKSPPVP